MPVWIVLGVCAAVFVMAVAIAGSFNLFDGGMPAGRDHRPRRLLAPGFDVADLDEIALSPALRGYRMDEVDAVIAEMSERIREQDERIRRQETRIRELEFPTSSTGAAEGEH
ncbi:hypothetical protein GCM10022261_16180 [Brevibacterium daeguense]|uniref:DivIVA domain-containing protein n=1 Tax=Brevibacterium daeguense TaxID=909936 RepID=A0ABP8EJE5_9MICO|nr:hypothetical protein [Brevibacterium daeguense]